MILPTRQRGARAYPLAADVLRRRAGLTFPDTRRESVEFALGRVMERAGIVDPVEFTSRLAERSSLLDEVLDLVTVGETYFFREPAQFALLRSRVLPELAAGAPARTLRAWSAACATGEEAYSLAITGVECGVRLNVFGSDVAQERLRSARRGRYRAWSMRGVSSATIERFFTRVGHEFCVRPSIRQLAAFGHGNLLDGHASTAGDAACATAFDVIFCRNVFIYFDADAIARAATRLLSALAPSGWLFLGASDPPLAEFVRCDPVMTEAGLAYRHPTSARFASSPIPSPLEAPPPPPLRDPIPTVPEVPSAPAPREARPSDSGAPHAAAAATPRVAAPPRATTEPHGDAHAASVARVRALADAGSPHEAMTACAALLEREPERAELHELHATLLLEGGHVRAAVEAARRAVYLDRRHAPALLVLADALHRSRDERSACSTLRRAVRVLQEQSQQGDAEAPRLLAIARARLVHCPEPGSDQ